MAILNSVISWWIKKRIHQIELFIKYPHEVQAEWLKKLLSAAKNTEWGLKYDYKTITSREIYQERVPITDYESIKPYIIRLRQGEQNLLWHSDIKWLAKSSGTTNDKSKFIPVSYEALEDCHFKGGKDLLSIYCNNRPDSQIFTGTSLALGGSHQISEFNNESYYGDLSAIIIQNLPFWAEFRRTPHISIALMDEWERKIEKMAEVTVKRNVTSIAGVPSWTLVLIKKILANTKKSNLMEVWPNLELFIHGGVSFVPYKEQFSNLIAGNAMQYLETYNASEGFFGIQDRTNADDMLLMLDYGIFYEFIPVNQLESGNIKPLFLDQVDTQTNYAMVISTNAGLWRYMIGDTIKFTSTNPYRIKITGRTKNFINVVGEELIIDNAEKALGIACEKTHAIVRDFTAGPIFYDNDRTAAHEWLIEFEKEPENIEYFAEVLDNALKSLNSDYEAKRYHNLALSFPVIVSLPPNTFYKWLKKRGHLGGQHKVPRLANHRRYLEDIKQLI